MPYCRTNINSFSTMEFVVYCLLQELQLLQSFALKHRLHFINDCLINTRPPITNKICQNIRQKSQFMKQLIIIFLISFARKQSETEHCSCGVCDRTDSYTISVAWSISYPSHSCILRKPLNKSRCLLAGELVGSNNTW